MRAQLHAQPIRLRAYTAMSSAVKCTAHVPVPKAFDPEPLPRRDYEWASTNAAADLGPEAGADWEALSATKPAWRAAYTGEPPGPGDVSFSSRAWRA
jgi:hypothetical protein